MALLRWKKIEQRLSAPREESHRNKSMMGTFLTIKSLKEVLAKCQKYFSVILRAFGSRNLTVKEPDAGKGPHSWKFVLQSSILWLLSC